MLLAAAHPFFALWPLAAGLPARCLAAREEGVRYYLGRLPPRGATRRTEVRQVVRSAWLSVSSTWIARYYPSVGQALHIIVEGRAGRHVLK